MKAGGEAGGFSEAKTVSRVKAQGVRPEALGAVMKADTSKLPSYAGVELPGVGYAVYRVNKVSQPANPDAARRKNEQQQGECHDGPPPRTPACDNLEANP